MEMEIPLLVCTTLLVQVNLAPFRVNHSIIEYVAFPYSLWNSKHYSEDFPVYTE